MTETHTYTAQLDQAIERLHAEGRYRTFIDIVREKGNFPHAVWQREDGRTQPVTVRSGNDYLGMAKHSAYAIAFRARTSDIDFGKCGSGGGTRTPDTRIMIPLL
jgi:5-aminolevulinate synthase